MERRYVGHNAPACRSYSTGKLSYVVCALCRVWGTTGTAVLLCLSPHRSRTNREKPDAQIFWPPSFTENYSEVIVVVRPRLVCWCARSAKLDGILVSLPFWGRTSNPRKPVLWCESSCWFFCARCCSCSCSDRSHQYDGVH